MEVIPSAEWGKHIGEGGTSCNLFQFDLFAYQSSTHTFISVATVPIYIVVMF
jgi:hypothetical protein